jgi:hypothetical protein
VTPEELSLILIQAALLIFFKIAFGQKVSANLQTFMLACAMGTVAQWLLGPDLNHYTGNITLYFLGISVAIILGWGIGLTACQASFSWLVKITAWRPSIWLFMLVCMPIIVVVETIGSNVLRMKLENYEQYAPLMPMLNAMHAPPWLYLYYLSFALIFYGVISRFEFCHWHNKHQ